MYSAPFSIVDAIAGIVIDGKESYKIKCNRGQGFVMDSKEIARKNNLI